MDNTTWALVVAAVGVLAGPLTAWLTVRWSRDQAREQRAHEFMADQAKWSRDERNRRVLRGEEAAGRLLEVVDGVAAKFLEGSPSQTEVRPAYLEIRRLAELLSDDAARDRMIQVADAMYYWRQTREIEPYMTAFVAGNAMRDAAHGAIRAYLFGTAIPDAPRLERLRELINEAGQRTAEMMEDEDWINPLDPPEAREADREYIEEARDEREISDDA